MAHKCLPCLSLLLVLRGECYPVMSVVKFGGGLSQGLLTNKVFMVKKYKVKILLVF